LRALDIPAQWVDSLVFLAAMLNQIFTNSNWSNTSPLNTISTPSCRYYYTVSRKTWH